MVKKMGNVDSNSLEKGLIEGDFTQKFQKLDELEFTDLIELLLSLSNVGINDGIIKNLVDYFKDKSNLIIASFKNKEYLSNSDTIYLQYVDPVVGKLILKSELLSENKSELYIYSEYKCEEFDLSDFTKDNSSYMFTGEFILKKDSSGKVLNIYFIDGEGNKYSIQELNDLICVF